MTSGGTVDLFGVYVRCRLDAWGREFALSRDNTGLGHSARNMLQLLIEHGGEMPPRQTGHKPLEIDQPAHQVELLVTDIARRSLERACCLRGYYCGNGRRGVERLDIANDLFRRTDDGRRIGRHAYFAQVRLGFADVSDGLQALARQR